MTYSDTLETKPCFRLMNRRPHPGETPAGLKTTKYVCFAVKTHAFVPFPWSDWGTNQIKSWNYKTYIFGVSIALANYKL